GIDETAKSIITELLEVRKGRNLNELFAADIIHAIKGGITAARNVKVTTPTDDVTLSKDKIIILGTVTVTVQKDVA
ncbi:MAG TPA: baseplate J protein, partial [Ruminiclostridium sp.]|nr:baseplate J protein [Ruminiclostridium sp.]